MTATITLADGTVLSNLIVNGDNFLSPTKITRNTFDNTLSPVVISITENGRTITTEHAHMYLLQITHPDEYWWFVIQDIPENDLLMADVYGKLDYLAMMSDIEFDDLEF